jgi:hypothetical protein
LSVAHVQPRRLHPGCDATGSPRHHCLRLTACSRTPRCESWNVKNLSESGDRGDRVLVYIDMERAGEQPREPRLAYVVISLDRYDAQICPNHRRSRRLGSGRRTDGVKGGSAAEPAREPLYAAREVQNIRGDSSAVRPIPADRNVSEVERRRSFRR